MARTKNPKIRTIKITDRLSLGTERHHWNVGNFRCKITETLKINISVKKKIQKPRKLAEYFFESSRSFRNLVLESKENFRFLMHKEVKSKSLNSYFTLFRHCKRLYLLLLGRDFLRDKIYKKETKMQKLNSSTLNRLNDFWRSDVA